MFRCNECSITFEDEAAIRHHLSSRHFQYYPHRCEYCKDEGEMHSTTTEEKMKLHTNAIHQQQDLKISTWRNDMIENQLQMTVENCRVNPPNSRLHNMLRQAFNVLSDSDADSSAGGAMLSVEKQNESIYQTSEATIGDTTEPLPHAKFVDDLSVNELQQKSSDEVLGQTEVEEQSLSTNESSTESSSKIAISEKQQTTHLATPLTQANMASEAVEDPNKNEKDTEEEITIPPLTKTKPNRKRKFFADAQTRSAQSIIDFVNANEDSFVTDDTTIDLDPVVSTEPETAEENCFKVTSNLITVSSDGTTASELSCENEQEAVQIEKRISNNEIDNGKEFSHANEVVVDKTSDVEVSTTSPLAAKNPLECVLCDFTASQERVLKRHMTSKKHIGTRVLKCHYCSFQSVLNDALNTHILEKHEKGKPKEKNSPVIASVNTPRKKK